MKTFFKIVLTALAAVVLLFAVGRYGWRLVGFRACDGPSRNHIESVTVEADSVHVRGGAADSFSSYVGYIHEFSGGKLYLGVKHNGFLGFFQRIGDFSITVLTSGQTVSEVYLKGGDGERLIWAQTNGMAANQASDETPLPEDTAATDDVIVQAGYPFDDVDAQNDLCAVVFLGYDEASINQAVSGLCSEYAVLRELFLTGGVVAFDGNGAEQYLILPKYAGSTITVSRVTLAEDGSLQPEGDALITESLLRVCANNSDIVPSTQITVQFGGQSITFSPFISLKDGNIAEIDGAYTLMG